MTQEGLGRLYLPTVVSFEGKRIERNMLASCGRRYVVVHGTWCRTDAKLKLRKKHRRAFRAAWEAHQEAGVTAA